MFKFERIRNICQLETTLQILGNIQFQKIWATQDLIKIQANYKHQNLTNSNKTPYSLVTKFKRPKMLFLSREWKEIKDLTNKMIIWTLRLLDNLQRRISQKEEAISRQSLSSKHLKSRTKTSKRAKALSLKEDIRVIPKIEMINKAMNNRSGSAGSIVKTHFL